MELSSLEPKDTWTLMRLVEEAGIDVSDWGNYKKGPEFASSNPSYCYNWSFVDLENQVVILNLWFDTLEKKSGTISYRLNLRHAARSDPDGGRRKRARAMDEALRLCYEKNLAPRVIIQDGPMKNGKRKAKYRLLDEAFWTISSYDYSSGNCLLERKPLAPRYVDQFSIPDLNQTSRIDKTSSVHVRDSRVRDAVLARADGLCEYCGVEGFMAKGGYLYLETHHIIPLSEGGPDTKENVIAICANDHRMAHYGESREDMRECFTKVVQAKLSTRGEGG